MANLFAEYPIDMGTSVVPAKEPAHEAEWEREQRIREINEMKAFTETLIKSNKLQKQQMKLRRAEIKAAKKAAKKRKKSGVMKFFRNLGKAVCETVPDVLMAITVGAIGYFFNVNVKPGKMGWHVA